MKVLKLVLNNNIKNPDKQPTKGQAWSPTRDFSPVIKTAKYALGVALLQWKPYYLNGKTWSGRRSAWKSKFKATSFYSCVWSKINTNNTKFLNKITVYNIKSVYSQSLGKKNWKPSSHFFEHDIILMLAWLSNSFLLVGKWHGCTVIAVTS